MAKSLQPIEFNKELTFHETTIPGLLIADIPVYGDSRGWFKENFQKEKMIRMGLPDIDAIQNNISFNTKKGATRGIHAEPWDKFISIGFGKVFGAWVDLREGESFGSVFTTELDPSKAIFVPRGVGNSYQALEDNTVYTYLVNDHWSPEAQSEYVALNLADKTAKIKWPIPLNKAEISDKDKGNPSLNELKPMKPRKTLITGANGQLGKALQVEFPDAEFTDYQELDITSPNLESTRNWRQYDTIINAAGYTAVDKAETLEGRKDAWRLNAQAVANLSKIATKYDLTLVHISSDYVFDGTKNEYDESEVFCPLGVYAQTKTAGDITAATAPKHYIVRTSWVIGNGNNFVRTMKSLAEKGIKPSVVDDQVGRLSFTDDLARAIKHLLTNEAGVDHGTYNVTGDGPSASWAEIASEIYEQLGHKKTEVTGVSTAEYYADKADISPRPHQSTLSLDKIKKTGFKPTDWRESLKSYLKKEMQK